MRFAVNVALTVLLMGGYAYWAFPASQVTFLWPLLLVSLAPLPLALMPGLEQREPQWATLGLGGASLGLGFYLGCAVDSDARLFGFMAVIGATWLSSVFISELPREDPKALPPPEPEPAPAYLPELERYDEDVTAPAAAEKPPDRPEWASSGTFRVDRRRALGKLRRFQLSDAEQFLLPWLRCAVLSGASEIRLEASGFGLWMRFNGEPLPAAVMKDPYAGLFSELGQDSARARHLAVGLLAALRLQPVSVELSSGQGAARRGFRLKADVLQTPPEPEGGAETVLHIEGGSAWADASLAKAEAAFGPCKARLWIGGREILPPQAGMLLAFKQRAAKAWFGRSTRYRSRIRVYKHGALAEVLYKRLEPVQVEAVVDDSRLQLNASQSGVTRDSAFAWVFSRLQDSVGTFEGELLASAPIRARREKGRLRELLSSLASELGLFPRR